MCESSDEEECISTSEYFLSAVRKLCLNDFPHGFGKWRLSIMDYSLDVLRAKHKIKESYDDVDDLVDLIKDKNSPWTSAEKWSNEISSLKEIAVRHPEVFLNEDFIWRHFQTLKFSDKNISEIDADVVHLINLQSLVLSVNKIQTFETKNLPKCLAHLELFGNYISKLCTPSEPTNICFLGLGQNCLSDIDKYFTPQFWPNLNCLDLCLNNLVDLPDLCQQLKELQNLTSVSIFGNPASFISLYKYYTLDVICQLNHLDGSMITALERKKADGLKDRDNKDPELHEGKIMVQILQMNGFPEMSEGQNKCFIRYSFVTDCTFKPLDHKPNMLENSEAIKEVLFQCGDCYTTRSYEWKANIEVNETVVIRFPDLKVLKGFLFGNLRVEVIEERAAQATKTPVSKETSKLSKKGSSKRSSKKSKKSSSSQSQSSQASKDEIKEPEMKYDRRYLQIFSIPLNGLLGVYSQQDFNLSKKLLFETSTSSTERPIIEEVRQEKDKKKPKKKTDKKVKKKTSSKEVKIERPKSRNIVSGILNVKMKVAIVRKY